MKEISLNFKSEETFITDYRIEEAQECSQIIVKTASEEYYVLPYSIDNLETIRIRMLQEYYDIFTYKMDNVKNMKIGNFGITLGFIGLIVSILNIIPTATISSISLLKSLIFMGVLISGMQKTISNVIKNKKIRKKIPNVLKFNCKYSKENINRKLNIIFNKKDKTSKIISSTILEQEIVLPKDLDEKEYVVLTQISENDVNWQCLPEHYDKSVDREEKNGNMKSPNFREIESKNSIPSTMQDCYWSQCWENLNSNDEPQMNTKLKRILKK